MTPQEPLAMGAGREFDAIRAMVDGWGALASGIGDDASVLALPRGDALVATVDTAIENVHFREGWLTPRELGWRAGAATLSDLAAMGAVAHGLLIAIGVPDRWRDRLLEISEGLGEVTAAAGARIIGGNTSRAGELSITCTALGSVHEAGALARGGLRPGDRLYVTGRLGGPRAALEALLAGAEPAPPHRERFARPVPRIREGRWLAGHGAVAAIDVSDGLASDAGHLAAASGVAIVVDAGRIPCVEGVDPAVAFGSGEEYELLVGARGALDAGEFERAFGVPLTEIGSVDAGSGVALERDGERVAYGGGHDHFSRA